MNKLPEEMLMHILEFLPVRDLFKEIILVNITICSSLQNHYTLKRLSQLITGCETSVFKNYSDIQSIIKKSLKHSKKKPLEFMGFGTTGGVDDDLSQYWVENLFMMNSSSYCSNLGPGFTCVAVIRKSQKCSLTNTQKKYRKIAAKIIRKNPIISNLIQVDKKSKEPLLPLEEATFLTIMRENPEIITVFETGYAQETFLKVLNTLTQTTLKLSNFKQNDENLLFRDIDHNMVEELPMFACIKGFFISRKGDYSCPGKTFWIYCSEKYFHPDKFNLLIFERTKTIEEVKVICENENDLQIDEITENEFYQICYFKRRPGVLKPILWFKFLSNKTETAEINLRHYYSAKYIYVSFTDFENRMAQMNDHHLNPNIDFTYIVPFGFEFFG